MKEKTKPLLKLIAIFLSYFVYTAFITAILNLCGITDDIVSVFIADLVFFLGVIIVYKDTIKDGYNEFVHKYSISKKIIFVIKWVAILFAVNMIGGILSETLFPGLDTTDDNTNSLYALASLSTIYTIFKTMIFSVVAEELLFRKTIRDVIDNKILFVIISSLIYALMNIAYSSFSIVTMVSLIPYFIFSATLSFIYVKNDNNIFMTMLIKFCYNLIPLTILLAGIGG